MILRAVVNTLRAIIHVLAAIWRRLKPAVPVTTADGQGGCDDSDAANAICPDDPETRNYIERVTSTSFGVSILMTAEGIDLARTCDGAETMVTMASDLYARIPADHRLRDDLLWANPTIRREVFSHAWAAWLGIDNGNPVDIVFDDYTGESSTLQGRFWHGPLSRVFDLGCNG
jgi:hypothetical protein